MSLKTRPHAITFRLGASEYAELVKVVSQKGSRSMSEFARTAVLNSIVADSLDQFIDEELNALMVCLETVDVKVRGLRRHIRQLLTASDLVGS
jgi:hypothetical protein